MNQSNYFPSVDLGELILITYFIFLITFNYLDSNVITFTSTLNMVKENPNHIPKNMADSLVNLSLVFW